GRRCLGPACECDRWLEIWNLVFMQFNRDAAGKMTPLPRPSIDTGMGLERMAAVMQGKRSDYETDLFAPLIRHIAQLSGKSYGLDSEHDVSMQVIADHVRTTTFLIADGVLPSNEWRGYVLRRIMRRAMRHGRKLGLAEPFLWRGVAWVGEVMGAAYPEIVRERDRIIEVVRQEEEQFARTLDQGMRRIEEYAQAQGAGRGRPIDGRFLFTLYDTYGFPRDLAEEILVDQGWRVSDETEATWTQEMEAQRERARAKAAFGGDEEATEAVALYQRIGGSLPRPQQFLGYETLTAPAKILAIVADGRRVREAASGDEIEVILDRTPGYAESGGQIGDRGTLVGRTGRGDIVDTYYRGSKLIVHRVQVRVVKIGDFSTELCGGTHLEATGQIGFFKVAEEGAVAAGVRRIEAVAGTAAVEAVARRERVLREIADILKIGAEETPQRLRKLLDEQKALERQLAEMETKLARGKADDLVASARALVNVWVGRQA